MCLAACQTRFQCIGRDQVSHAEIKRMSWTKQFAEDATRCPDVRRRS